jgi:Phage portal protein
VISPKGGAMATPDDAEATKAWFTEQFSGDNRGKPLVMGAATEVSQYGFNPQQMNMSEARDVAEERVCALIGIPAAVVGFGAGLQSTKVGATMEEMRKLAWHNGVLPIARLIADELQRSLLPLFGKAQGLTVEWDTDDVPAMQEDEDKRSERWNKRLASGGVTLYEYREALGLEADDSDRIYLRPINLIEVREGQAASTPAPVPASPPAPAPKARGLKADRAAAEQYKRGVAFVRLLQRQERGLSKAFEAPLRRLFGDLATAAGEAAKPLVKSQVKEGEQSIVDQILEKLGIDAWQSRYAQITAAHYEAVVNATSEAAADAGLGTSMPDQVARSVIAAGGRRAAMVDLDEQTRAAVFDALAEGRAAGEGTEALAKRIVEMVDGGPWSDAWTRARVIARTETKYAQNISTIERARAAGVEKFTVFDGRFGPGRSTPSHIARDGSVVTAAEAETMAEEEHPNGTLSFAPYFGD